MPQPSTSPAPIRHSVPIRFVVVEKWASMAALKAHAAAPHMKALGEKTAHLVAARAVHVLEAA
jgi:quinol monooxygenase YgiN